MAFAFLLGSKIVTVYFLGRFQGFLFGNHSKTIQNQLVVFLINFGKVFALVNLERAK
jgi:hypothetical protein